MLEESVRSHKALLRDLKSAHKRAKKANKQQDEELQRAKEELVELEAQLEQARRDKDHWEQQIAMLGGREMLS
jgi:septal ring factor EnvC (AmiA/AmiB activator)